MAPQAQNKVRAFPKLMLMGVLILAPTFGWSLDLKTVLENTAVTPPSRVGFREQRHNPMFKEPIVLTGYLEYLEAGQLRKVIETPFEEAFLITEDHIEIEREGKTRRLSTGKSRSLRAALGGVEAILAGQTDRLISLFRYELTGEGDCWSLHLEPFSKAVSTHMTNMLIKGDSDSANSIRLEFKSGEWSLMELFDIDTNL